MDRNDINLTNSQELAVRQFIDAADKLKEEGVAVILDYDNSLLKFCNGREVMEFGGNDLMFDYPDDAFDITDIVYQVNDIELPIDDIVKWMYGDSLVCLPKGVELV